MKQFWLDWDRSLREAWPRGNRIMGYRMTSLSGEFQTDLALTEALVACAEAIDGLGWPIDSVEAERIVAHAGPFAEDPPTIELIFANSDGGTGITISGRDSESHPLEQDELISELTRVRDAVEVSLDSANPSETESVKPEHVGDVDSEDQELGASHRDEQQISDSGEDVVAETQLAAPGWYPAHQKGQLQYWDGHEWTSDYRQADGTSEDSSSRAAENQPGKDSGEIEANPVGVGLALVGAALMVTGVFLPHVESQQFLRVADNTLIQSGDGWIFIGLAVFIALAVYAAVRRRRRTMAVLILAAIGIAAAIYDGTGDRVRLGSLNPGAASALGIQATEQASPGTGIYAVGAGSGLAALGGLLLAGIAFGGARGIPARTTKQCPECAETVLSDARVCKHCSFRFET